MQSKLMTTVLAVGMVVAGAMLGVAPAAEAEFGIMPGTFVQSLSSSQAGAHADVTTAFQLNTTTDPKGKVVPDGNVKDVEVELPPGLVGDAQAMPKCTPSQLSASVFSKCPTDTQVGFARVELSVGGYFPVGVFNMAPDAGEPAAFGFVIIGVPVTMSVRPRTDGDYGLTAVISNIPDALPVFGTTLTFWGVPADVSHDTERFLPGEFEPGLMIERESEVEPGETVRELKPLPSHAPHLPFMINPSACGLPLTTTIRMDSWQSPGHWTSPLTSTPSPMTGCEKLSFDPSLMVEPETSRADSPSGYTVDLSIPQNEAPGGLATSTLKNAVVSLPANVVLSPSAGDGLEACSDAAFAVSSTAPAGCPPASQIGTVKVVTPLLSNPLEGQLFIGEPLCGNTAHPAPCEAKYAEEGKLFRLFLQARGSGVTLKLPGTISVNPSTGQVTTKFLENPQLPFSELKLNVDGGPRAALANPGTCGMFTATSDLTPWSSPFTPDATPSSEFEVTGCAAPRFAPSFMAGTTNNQAGAFSPFTVTLSRTDQDQGLNGVTAQAPPGLLGLIKSVTPCAEPQASSGKCGPESLIGHTTVGVGPGPHPLYLGGSVFLTGPYKGAPFGASIVVPAKAGPFNLGTEVVRAAIRIDPRTAAVTIASDPLPRILDGVPLQIRTVNVTVDRPGFMFNPTSCEPLSIGGTITSTQGATANVSSRFQAANCANLPFRPSFSALVRAKHSKKNGASLHVVVKSAAGQANIGSVKVNLPKQLPSRLSTLNQACLEATFKANPGACPAGSKVGGATAYTPVLPVALTGPAYFVSHGGAKFPELVVVLQGDGVTVDLAGETFINEKTGITSSTFRSVPDVPITRFDLNLPTGAHSAFAGNGNFCKGAMYMPTQIKGQNGAVVKQKTKIAVSGCPKGKKAKKKK